MSNVVLYISFHLAEGASASDFLLASEELNNGFMSKQKGFISWKQLVEGRMWVDLLTWESMEDAKNVMEPSCTNALAEKFYSFIDQQSVQVHLFSVERSY